MKKVGLIVLIVITICAGACSVWGVAKIMTSNQKQSPQKIWGNGDPPAEHQEFFGNDNLSRLCFVQTQTINRQGQALAELTLRVAKLEDPNFSKGR